jgi:uncharacterized membrane protein
MSQHTAKGEQIMATKAQYSVVINQPVEQVFAFMTDIRNNITWQPGAIEIKGDPDGLAQVGTRVTDVRAFLGLKMTSSYEVIEVEPNRRMGMKSLSGPFPYSGVMRFEAQGGGTRVTFEAEMEPKALFKLAGGMLASAFEKELARQLTTAKQLLEATPASVGN